MNKEIVPFKKHLENGCQWASVDSLVEDVNGDDVANVVLRMTYRTSQYIVKKYAQLGLQC